MLWQHLFWFFGHPEVYIMILPAFGIISEVLPVFARKPIFGYKAIAASTAAIAFLGMLVWAHHMFTTPTAHRGAGFFMLASFAIAVPTGIKIFNWIATLWRGTIIFKTPLYFAAGLIGMFVIGGISGVMLAVFPVDWQLHDTYFVVAHLHYVLVRRLACSAIFAGLYYWFPKMSGRMLGEALGKTSFWLMFVGFNLTFLDPALGGPIRHAAPHLRVPALLGLGDLQRHLHGRLVHPRHRRAGDGDQRADLDQARQEGRQRPVGGQHARVVRAVAAAAEQLRRDPARALGRADEGHPPRGAPQGAARRPAPWRSRCPPRATPERRAA